MEFISSLVGSLAWPLALVLGLLLFKGTVTELLSGQLQRLKAGPVELEWERTLAEARLELDYPSAPLAAGLSRRDLRAEFHQLLKRSPTEAIIEATAGWRRP